MHRKNVKERNVVKTMKRNTDKKEMVHLKQSFDNFICDGPTCVCSVCFRRLFRKQVVLCKRETYSIKGIQARYVAQKCISEKYLHRCTDNCDDDCFILRSPASTLWICHTCHRKILSGNLPAEAAANNLNLDDTPPELKCLNQLERHLVALYIPFMKVLALPKGGMSGVHGPVVCVPSNVQTVTNLLPRCETDNQMIRVKLKRKLTYKGHHEYKFVNKTFIDNALHYLRVNNKCYKDVGIDKNWINPLPVINEDDENDETVPDAVIQTDDESHLQNKEANTVAESTEPDSNGLLTDTCLQPVDIGQEVLDQHFQDITCIAPAEGNSPVRILMDKCNEAKAFPILFPTGAHTLNDDREVNITLARYLHTRLMHADGRFAKDTDYIFYAQYLSELHQVVSCVSIALRKGTKLDFQKDVTIKSLTDGESLRKLLQSDEGYKFLKPIRGTPPFWQNAQKDLFAMLRQLGVPTWFCSFSSAELRWPEVIEAILLEECDSRKASDLDWSEKCSIIRRNPVTAARMFDHRFRCFLKQVIMSPAHPLGKIKDYFYRVEFQQRGSPHTHCLFWVEDAPRIDKHDDEDVKQFVDKYVTCEMPPENSDSELHDIVNTVQKHSQSHSKSCRKKGTTCRFNFPRPPSGKTFICRAADQTHDEINTKEPEQMGNEHDVPDARKSMTTNEAKDILSTIWKAIKSGDQEFESVEELFQNIQLSQELFETACKVLAQKTSVVLKRHPNDVWINQYNSDLLRCWNANMDIQYIVDAYACIVYVISYISKSEREMGLLLEHAQKEATNDGNKDAKSALKKLGSVYLHNRELGAQEAVFRVCNLRLKEGSRKVNFIPAGMNPIKMSQPLAKLNKISENGDLEDDDIWMTGIVDRYKSRPESEEFDNLCLASFSSEYRILCKSQVPTGDIGKRSNIFKLKNDHGYIQKRTRTDPAIIRYARFSKAKDPEKYYHSMIQLFLPYRFDLHLKPNEFKTYEEFHRTGAVCVGSRSVESVQEIISRNKGIFEKEADEIDEAEQLLEKCGSLEDAWSQICPESELMRLESENEIAQREASIDESDENMEENIPDLLQSNTTYQKVEILQSLISRDEAETLLRSLNMKQSEFFYKVRQWCLDKKNGSNPDPIHAFLTGGAGTGKSHLIKAISFEATRLLASMLTNPDDVSVLIVAPTGVAAFNIGASTIHSTLSIGIDAKLPYQPLGDEKINSLRAKYGSLQILIIDEISMVNHTLLTYIHGRLRQIKQTGDYSPFGKVSIIAVGDFYQLRPVKGKPLYQEALGVDLWNDYFHVTELTEIMRQKDSAFAEMLNRLRTRKKSESIYDDDIAMLCSRETGEESNAIHIFSTNQQVDECNRDKLHSNCVNPIEIEAIDFTRANKTGKLKKADGHHTKVYNTNLAKRIYLAVGARVMLTKNIDISDGLVNGVFGTVAHLSFGTNKKFPEKVYVMFDKGVVGKKLRTKMCPPNNLPENCTAIEPEEERVTNNQGTRRQYPLKLAWACTVHKVQGLTVEKAVVCLNKIFTAGQAYVALSRVTTITGLTIKDFKQSAIYANEKISACMLMMPRFINTPKELSNLNFTIILHNIEGLKSHITDIQCDARFMQADIMCLTETWLLSQSQANSELDGFQFHGKSRSDSYESSSELKTQLHGGVGVYFKKPIEIPVTAVSNMEYITLLIKEYELSVTVIYRPNSYKASVFKPHLLNLICELEKLSPRSIIMGDFNENVLTSSSIRNLFASEGYEQMVSRPTTEAGTCIDLVFVRNFENVMVNVMPTYFGYHEAVQIKF